MNSSHLRARVRTRRPQIAAAGTALLASLALHAGTASASTKQATLVVDPIGLQENPSAEVAQFRALGATEVRVMLQWSTIAPSARSTRQPRFTATNPGAYPAANWNQWDQAIRAVTAAGMKVDLDVMGGPPRWAQGPGVPSSYNNGRFGWRVNAKDYGQFVKAVATRYDGKYKPKGSSSALPQVKIWSLWNEPNFGEQLGPQNIGATAKSTGYNVAAGYYRAMLRSAWSALRSTKGSKTILVGEFAGEGRSLPKTRKFPQGLPGNVAIDSPVSYIETLYCLDSHHKSLTGTAAKDASCPTSAGARRSFVKNNPALFDASAISMHPYASTFAPNASAKKIPSSYIILPVIGRLTSEMSAVTRAWHHTRNYPIWSTEYGFVTSPPQKNKAGTIYPSPQEAAIFLNEAEYLSYRNSHVATYSQYLLSDPKTIKGAGLFSSGLQYSNGKPKPGYDAFRLPLWVPHQTVRKGSSAEIWGGARPAVAAAKLGGKAKQVAIQMQSHGSWKTIHTITVNGSTGYFDTHLRLSSGGSMRLAYTYPSNELGLPVGDAGKTVYSRTLKVTVR